jgi:hypothetical protein
MNAPSTRAQRRQLIQQQILKNRNLLGKAETDQQWQQPNIL